MEAYLTALIVLGWGMMVALPQRRPAQLVAVLFGLAWAGSRALLLGGSITANLLLVGPVIALAIFAAWPLARAIGRLARDAVASGA